MVINGDNLRRETEARNFFMRGKAWKDAERCPLYSKDIRISEEHPARLAAAPQAQK